MFVEHKCVKHIYFNTNIVWEDNDIITVTLDSSIDSYEIVSVSSFESIPKMKINSLYIL